MTKCWLYQGYIMPNGYGQVRRGGKAWLAHRLAYTELVGPVPQGLDLDHLCRNRACYNPAHLEPVTRSVNLRRGVRARGAEPKHGTVSGYINLICRSECCMSAKRLYEKERRERIAAAR